MGSRARKSSIDAICSPLLPLPLSIGSSREIWFAFPEGNRGNERFSSKGGVEYHDLPPYSNSRYPFSLSRHKTLTLQRAWFYEVTEYDSMLRILPPPSFFLRRYAYVLRVCLFALFVLIFSFQIRYSPDEKRNSKRKDGEGKHGWSGSLKTTTTVCTTATYKEFWLSVKQSTYLWSCFSNFVIISGARNTRRTRTIRATQTSMFMHRCSRCSSLEYMSANLCTYLSTYHNQHSIF